jgi:hypothetical protein
MIDSNQYARITELTEMIEKERDREKFEQLVGELNALLDEQKKPVGKSPATI